MFGVSHFVVIVFRPRKTIFKIKIRLNIFVKNGSFCSV